MIISKKKYLTFWVPCMSDIPDAQNVDSNLEYNVILKYSSEAKM